MTRVPRRGANLSLGPVCIPGESPRDLRGRDGRNVRRCALGAQREHGHARSLSFVVAACVDAVRAGLGERRRHGQLFRRGQVLGSVARDLVTRCARSRKRARSRSSVSFRSASGSAL